MGQPATFDRPWSADEDDTLRVAYSAGGIAAAEAALPGRSQAALFHRARRLDLSRRRRWTASDDSALRDLWDQALPLTTICRRLGRTRATTYWRAQKLGLPLGVPDGFEYLSHASERTGYSPAQLRRILRWAKAPIRKALSRTSGEKRRRHFHVVDPFDVDEAVSAWTQTETAESAARRLGIDGTRLRARLRKVGVATGRGQHARVTERDLERANALGQWKKRSRGSLTSQIRYRPNDGVSGGNE